jgi:DUF1365 family protein
VTGATAVGQASDPASDLASDPASKSTLPARYDVRIRHVRNSPMRYALTQRSTIWLVDLDAVPVLRPGLGWLARFDAHDHDLTGRAQPTIRANLDAFLTERGRPRPARVLMLANPRVLGYVFNPLSVFYCYDADGAPLATVAEVRNTYSGRHTYLVDTDETGRAETDKVFYVSPFYPVDGRYTLRLPVPGFRVLASVTLHRAEDSPFHAVMATRAVMLGIKRHGITLYAKGLRPIPRPSRQPAARPEPIQQDDRKNEAR